MPGRARRCASEQRLDGARDGQPRVSRSRRASSNSQSRKRRAACSLRPLTCSSGTPLLVERRCTTPPALRRSLKDKRWKSPRNGISAPLLNGTGRGRLSRRSRTHSRLRLRKLPASSRSHCTGSVTMTARLVRLTRSVRRRAPGWRRTSTSQPSSSIRGRFNTCSSSALVRRMIVPRMEAEPAWLERVEANVQHFSHREGVSDVEEFPLSCQCEEVTGNRMRHTVAHLPLSTQPARLR